VIIGAYLHTWFSAAAPELPHDARASLYVETVPKDASRREIAHIFRPFAGFKVIQQLCAALYSYAASPSCA
jgi:hypothetical protein